MRRDAYDQLVQALQLPVGACPNQRHLLSLYATDGLQQDGLVSIYGQENQYRVIKNNHVVKQRIHSYTRRYLAGEDLLVLSAEVDFPPCMLIRRILEHMLPGSKQVVSEILRQPCKLDSLMARCGDQLPQEALSAVWPGTPHSTPLATKPDTDPQGDQQQQTAPKTAQACSTHTLDAQGGDSSESHPGLHQLVARLKMDISRCVLSDSSYSPLCDAARQAAGIEHELLLAAKLRSAGVSAFWTETELRALGCFKTPDIRMQVPFAVRRRSTPRAGASRAGITDPASAHGDQTLSASNSHWHVVTWIDSKAAFGDDRIHQKQLEDQYRTYVNRYGPGLVIYWFGFLDDLDTDSDVMLMDHFPSKADLCVLPSTMPASN